MCVRIEMTVFLFLKENKKQRDIPLDYRKDFYLIVKLVQNDLFYFVSRVKKKYQLYININKKRYEMVLNHSQDKK